MTNHANRQGQQQEPKEAMSDFAAANQREKTNERSYRKGEQQNVGCNVVPRMCKCPERAVSSATGHGPRV
jgi:hypothetical protein